MTEEKVKEEDIVPHSKDKEVDQPLKEEAQPIVNDKEESFPSNNMEKTNKDGNPTVEESSPRLQNDQPEDPKQNSPS